MLQTYLRGQFVLTGTPEAVGRLVAAAAQQRGIQMVSSRTLTLTHRGRTLQAGLYTMPGYGAASEPAALRAVGQLIALSRSEGLPVAVEPNCGTGTPFAQEANPFEWEGSPFEWEGSPYAGTANDYPRVVPAGSTPEEGERLFWSQPAFRRIGLTDESGRRRPSLACHDGDGVLVGIFDTLPSAPVSEPWLTLHPASTRVESPSDQPVNRDFSDHGLVAASLVNAIAPKAEVHLYEVLASDAYGTIFPLLEALSDFIAMAEGRPAVMNLSLGSLCASPKGSPALMALLQKATDLGMVVCAAAGNRGRDAAKPSALLGAQVPAAFANVIAVSATRVDDSRASYSQRGDVAAPGGAALGDPGPGDAEDIIGRGVSDPAGQPSGYVAMDAGTSFATPLVAGAAALVVAEMVRRGTPLSPNLYAEVLNALRGGAIRPDTSQGETLENCGLGVGILHLPTSLGAC